MEFVSLSWRKDARGYQAVEVQPGRYACDKCITWLGGVSFVSGSYDVFFAPSALLRQAGFCGSQWQPTPGKKSPKDARILAEL